MCRDLRPFVQHLLSWGRLRSSKLPVVMGSPDSSCPSVLPPLDMAVILPDSQPSTPLHDPLLPWLWSIKQALEDWNSGNDSGSDLTKLLSGCIAEFKDNDQYRDDIRFLKIWFFYMDFSEDFESVFQKMWESKICVGNSLLYVWYASFLESKGKLYDASMVYQMGISRNAKPVEWVKKAHALFLERMCELVSSAQTSGNDESIPFGILINPWSSSTMKVLLKKINHQLMKYDGYWCTANAYSGKVVLSSLKNSSRNKTIEIGCTKYQIIGCAGQGGSAQVYKAYVSCNPDDVVALKIQKPAFPWEFYMYRQLDQRISDKERSRFGLAISILTLAYLSVIILLMEHFRSPTSLFHQGPQPSSLLKTPHISSLIIGKSMEEVLCIYYTIEMLYMLKTLHGVGIIHGDFKPDNLLIRYAR
ncbi:PREDICTED: mitotic [Prunus dulcis]|uniref:PREDICTED: mitotic n=1 Tax=Prunus dulcis TaxID=3755 RepID=A0A5E4FL36_PRUDU|nr:PREDICTED: mitotic [Prunus dulcis]